MIPREAVTPQFLSLRTIILIKFSGDGKHDYRFMDVLLTFEGIFFFVDAGALSFRVQLKYCHSV